jgi:hypothetical protein
MHKSVWISILSIQTAELAPIGVDLDRQAPTNRGQGSLQRHRFAGVAGIEEAPGLLFVEAETQR